MSTDLKRVLDKDTVAMELMYTALVAYPSLERASAFMAEQGYEISTSKLAVYRDGRVPGHDVYLERRKELAPRLEAILADDMLGQAQRATEVSNMAIEKTQQLLEEGKVNDPSRVARDLSQVAAQSVDKRLALQGRPTQVTANRSIDELTRALVGLGVAQVAELDVPEAEVVED